MGSFLTNFEPFVPPLNFFTFFVIGVIGGGFEGPMVFSSSQNNSV